MKTSITDDMELPEEVQAVARREALRRNEPVGVVLAEWIADKAKAITEAAAKRRKASERAGAAA